MSSDYLNKFRSEMVQVLPTRSKREKEAFAALDLHEQAWRFMNWQSRLVHPHPRQVNIADGFDSLPDVQANLPGIAALLGRIERGEDVRAYLSRDVMTQGYCLHPIGRKHGPDFDLLLNEWGIHHLHTDPRRSKEVLYVIFGRGVAFALAVAPHGAWTSRSLIEATVRSWPAQGLFVNLGVMPGEDFTENEHKGLRKAGVTTATTIANRLWFSGVTGGITTALVSTRMSMNAAQLIRCLQHVTDHPESLTEQLSTKAAESGIVWPESPVIDVQWLSGADRNCFGFVENACGATLFIDTASAMFT